jgi:hypothetical protein
MDGLATFHNNTIFFILAGCEGTSLSHKLDDLSKSTTVKCSNELIFFSKQRKSDNNKKSILRLYPKRPEAQ